jgi:hypothetical protein
MNMNMNMSWWVGFVERGGHVDERACSNEGRGRMSAQSADDGGT